MLSYFLSKTRLHHYSFDVLVTLVRLEAEYIRALHTRYTWDNPLGGSGNKNHEVRGGCGERDTRDYH